MHVPDGFINPAMSAVAGVGAAGGVAYSIRQVKQYLSERFIPLAALVAAFVFAAQMVNFPVLPGVSGHLIGGVLAAVLIGPSAGFLILAIVLTVQAFLFADGGISALGINILNLGGVAAVGGYYIYRLVLRFTTGSHRAVAASAAVAAFASVPLAAAAFAIEFAIAGTAESVSMGAVLWSLIGVHMVIGVGEGIITFFVVLAVVQSRPDLVYGSPDYSGTRTEELSLS